MRRRGVLVGLVGFLAVAAATLVVPLGAALGVGYALVKLTGLSLAAGAGLALASMAVIIIFRMAADLSEHLRHTRPLIAAVRQWSDEDDDEEQE